MIQSLFIERFTNNFAATTYYVYVYVEDSIPLSFIWNHFYDQKRKEIYWLFGMFLLYALYWQHKNPVSKYICTNARNFRSI